MTKMNTNLGIELMNVERKMLNMESNMITIEMWT